MSQPSDYERELEQRVERLERRLAVSAEIDERIEACRVREASLAVTLEEVLTAALDVIGARGIALRTQDEGLNPLLIAVGESGIASLIEPTTEQKTVRPPEGLLVLQPLLFVGNVVGDSAFLFPTPSSPTEEEECATLVHLVCEELDNLLEAVQAAGRKQKLILNVSEALTQKVLARGLDEAANVLHEAVGLEEMILVYRDDDGSDDEELIHYRLYSQGTLVAESEEKQDPALSRLVEEEGYTLLTPENHDLLGRMDDRWITVESVLINGLTEFPIGKIASATGGDGFNALAHDLVRVFAELVSQRLVDYNRERRHLSNFFSPGHVASLLRNPDYDDQYLRPREDRVGILYADIAGFTRLCGLVLRKPQKIGEFVNTWVRGAVAQIYEAGGTFDKMVGDCVIGIFGPPFFDDSTVERARRAIQTALDIRRFTEELGRSSAWAHLSEHPEIEDLTVSVGVHFCPALVGLLGPNRDFTAFSRGMNEAARLQSVAESGEILVMESMANLVEAKLPDSFTFGSAVETKVKNVTRPLKYRPLI